jgi:hypothetical protein
MLPRKNVMRRLTLMILYPINSDRKFVKLMALPRFSFSGGATDFFQPNQALFRTTFTPSDKLQSDTYQAEAKAYKDAVEKHNEALKVNPNVDPPKPTPLSFTQEEFDQFGVDASRRAQQLQNAKQNAFNAISNPSGFSQQYGIGSLGFETAER